MQLGLNYYIYTHYIIMRLTVISGEKCCVVGTAVLLINSSSGSGSQNRRNIIQCSKKKSSLREFRVKANMIA